MLFQSKNPDNLETMIKQKKPKNLETKNLVVFGRKKKKGAFSCQIDGESRDK